MSPSKHQANPRKRPINEVDAEFPSLPLISLRATVAFARKSQEALLSVRKGLSSADFSGTSSLFLPLISPHKLQQRFKVDDNSVFVHDSDEAKDALYWTGGVPYELFLLEKLLDYRKGRARDMIYYHKMFYDSLDNRKKKTLKECISHMALKMPPPIGREGMDRILFDIIKDDETGTKIITALDPVARRSLLEYHDKESLMSSLTAVAGHVLASTE